MLESADEVSSDYFKVDGGRGGYSDLSWEPREGVGHSFV
jgi:hypothetical protein